METIAVFTAACIYMINLQIGGQLTKCINDVNDKYIFHCDAVVRTVTPQQENPGFESSGRLGSLCVKRACTPCVCTASHWIQTRVCSINC